MAPTLLFDISNIDLNQVQHDVHEIERINPHRGAMRLIDGIIWRTDDYLHTVAYKDIRHDEFWVPGHIPGSPVFPGVLMIEASAQLASWVCLRRIPDEAFMGFAGVDKVKFRGQVVPGDRLIILCEETEFRRRRCICNTQGLVNGNLVFEAQITGMPMQVKASV
ncbi:MAG: 3-hydroxyacyl-ACP dehydratase FabZ family protein [Phycisphaeraceae bacterium]